MTAAEALVARQVSAAEALDARQVSAADKPRLRKCGAGGVTQARPACTRCVGPLHARQNKVGVATQAAVTTYQKLCPNTLQ